MASKNNSVATPFEVNKVLTQEQERLVNSYSQTTHFKERVNERFGIEPSMRQAWIKAFLSGAKVTSIEKDHVMLSKGKINLAIEPHGNVFKTVFSRSERLNMSGGLRKLIAEDAEVHRVALRRKHLGAISLYAQSLVDAAKGDTGEINQDELISSTINEINIEKFYLDDDNKSLDALLEFTSSGYIND